MILVESTLTELERSAKDRIATLESELHERDISCDEKLKSLAGTYNIRLDEQGALLKLAKDKEDELLKRISALSTTEDELRDKVHASENAFGERLRAASARERDLTEKINQLHKQLESLNKVAEQKERALEEKLHLTQDELVVLRQSRKTAEPQMSPRSFVDRPKMLQEEIESLRCVLELKQSEISDLRKQNHELVKAADALPAALVKVSALESRLEDIQIQLKCKSDEEK